MDEFEKLKQEILDFRDRRDWEQFHNAKDLSLALSIEAAELNQLFLWKKAEEVNVDRLKDELADVLNYAFLLAAKFDLDISTIVRDKMKKNDEKYPVEKAKGTAKKYNEL